MKLFRFIEDKPISPWGYVLYALLFAIPIVGFIFILVFSLGSGNQHRKNFARSYICALIVGVVLSIILTVLLLTGVIPALLN